MNNNIINLNYYNLNFFTNLNDKTIDLFSNIGGCKEKVKNIFKEYEGKSIKAVDIIKNNCIDLFSTFVKLMGFTTSLSTQTHISNSYFAFKINNYNVDHDIYINIIVKFKPKVCKLYIEKGIPSDQPFFFVLEFESDVKLRYNQFGMYNNINFFNRTKLKTFLDTQCDFVLDFMALSK